MARERLLAAVGTEAVTGVDMKFYDSTYKRDAGLPFLESIASGSADPYIAGIAEKTLEGVRKGSYTFPYHGILETFQEMEK